ncbi:MAG: cysteine hydrolase [Candidatus Micrarchaeota archaeon]|nr:cysteine hydrolase [Candidatus Micrarchaeota archaeon]
MKVPNSGRKKALLIIDLQSAFVDSRNNYLVQNIASLIKNMNYDFYASAIFHAEKNSLWDKQQNWTCPKNSDFHTVEPVNQLLEPLNVVRVEKETKSIFKGDKKLLEMLKRKRIEEVHVVGCDTNDCVLASAFEAFDLGFFTYVIEECCQAPLEELQVAALDVLRRQHMTNNSCVEKIDFITLQHK